MPTNSYTNRRIAERIGVSTGLVKATIQGRRGPLKISNQAIRYSAKEGYPYHLFEEAHL